MRTITGTALTVDGLPVANTVVSFTLVNNNVLPTASFDAVTYDRVYGTKSALTDVNGSFTISLYENDKLIDITYYLVKVDIANDVPFMSALLTGATVIDWLEFKATGETITPATLLIYEAYVARAEAAVSGAETAETNTLLYWNNINAQVTAPMILMATNLINTQTIVAQHHAFA